jgi:hypothetical protein
VRRFEHRKATFGRGRIARQRYYLMALAVQQFAQTPANKSRCASD